MTRQIERDDPDSDLQNVLVIGGDSFGLAVADCLTKDDWSVTFVSDRARTGDCDGVQSIQHRVADATDVRSLAEELPDIELVVVVGSDEQTLLTGYLTRREFDPCIVVVGVDDPKIVPAFEGTGVDSLCLPHLLAERLRERYG